MVDSSVFNKSNVNNFIDKRKVLDFIVEHGHSFDTEILQALVESKKVKDNVVEDTELVKEFKGALVGLNIAASIFLDRRKNLDYVLPSIRELKDCLDKVIEDISTNGVKDYVSVPNLIDDTSGWLQALLKRIPSITPNGKGANNLISYLIANLNAIKDLINK